MRAIYVSSEVRTVSRQRFDDFAPREVAIARDGLDGQFAWGLGKKIWRIDLRASMSTTLQVFDLFTTLDVAFEL